MKKNIVLLSALALVLFLANSCSEKFKVSAPYKAVTVVYGLLSVNDTAHYIKITRGFFDESKNNIDLAKYPDSIYYQTLSVKMEVKNSNGGLVKTILLDKVKLSDEGITKDTGVFVNNPAYAYKFKENLDPSLKYNLKFALPNGNAVEGITAVLGNVQSTALSGGYVFNFSDKTKSIPFNWQSPSNAGLVEFYLRFKFSEENTSTGASINKFIDLPIILNQEIINGNLNGYYEFRNEDFYFMVNSGITNRESFYKRRVDTLCDIIAYAGSKELVGYINQNKAQGGLTADQIKPIYSNLKGTDVYGLFSSRSRAIFPNIRINSATVDSMKVSPVLSDLNFIGVKL